MNPQAGTSPRREEASLSPTADASLEWLIHPITKDEFFCEYWEKKPLIVKRRQSDYYADLLSLDRVDSALTTLALKHPNVTLKNAERKVTADDYTLDGEALDVAKVYQLFREGSTITLAYLDDLIPSLASFCRGLEKEFSFPFQANVYLTPGKAKGARHHYDTHDVFVLQVANSKQWSLYGTPIQLPLSGQDFDDAVHGRGPVSCEFQLDPGDLAYVPRGLVHDARSADEVSLHITVGVLAYTWSDLLLELVADAGLNDVDFRRSLPPGFAQQPFDRSEARETVRALLQKVAGNPNFDAIFDRFVDNFITACPPLLSGQMSQIVLAENLTLDSVVGARTGSVSYVRTEPQSTTVDCYGRKITFPRHVDEAVRFALVTARFVVSEIPGGLDDDSKLTLARRLIREGLLVSLEY